MFTRTDPSTASFELEPSAFVPMPDDGRGSWSLFFVWGLTKTGKGWGPFRYRFNSALWCRHRKTGWEFWPADLTEEEQRMRDAERGSPP